LKSPVDVFIKDREHPISCIRLIMIEPFDSILNIIGVMLHH
jgi:hypothetical protein